MANASVGVRLRSMGLAVWHFVSGAPLTFGWLFVLMITTYIQHEMPQRQLHTMLLHHSTNIHDGRPNTNPRSGSTRRGTMA